MNVEWNQDAKDRHEAFALSLRNQYGYDAMKAYLDEIEHAEDNLRNSKSGQLGQPFGNNRRYITGRSKYEVIYAIDGGRIVIIEVVKKRKN